MDIKYTSDSSPYKDKNVDENTYFDIFTNVGNWEIILVILIKVKDSRKTHVKVNKNLTNNDKRKIWKFI